jgi:hypothetical protein
MLCGSDELNSIDLGIGVGRTRPDETDTFIFASIVRASHHCTYAFPNSVTRGSGPEVAFVDMLISYCATARLVGKTGGRRSQPPSMRRFHPLANVPEPPAVAPRLLVHISLGLRRLAPFAERMQVALAVRPAVDDGLNVVAGPGVAGGALSIPDHRTARLIKACLSSI